MDSESIVAKAIDNMNRNMEKMNDRHEKFVNKTDDKLDLIQSDVNKFVVLFEKLSHIEKNQTDGFKRVYHVIDDVKDRVANIEKHRVTDGCAPFATFIAGHDKELAHNVDRIKELEDDVEVLKEKPVKRVETILRGFLIALGAGFFTYITTTWKGE
jgi:hypothetical protein